MDTPVETAETAYFVMAVHDAHEAGDADISEVVRRAIKDLAKHTPPDKAALATSAAMESLMFDVIFRLYREGIVDLNVSLTPSGIELHYQIVAALAKH